MIIAGLSGQVSNASGQNIFEDRILTTHFIILFDETDAGLAKELAKTADSLRNRVLRSIGTNTPDHTTVILTKDISKMNQAAPKGTKVPGWASGIAFIEENLILLRTISQSGKLIELEQVFIHEWAHLALGHAVGSQKTPRWFHEGFAIHQSQEWSFARTRILMSASLSNRLLTLQELSDHFPQDMYEIELAYAQSIDFIGYLLGNYSLDSFNKLIELLSKEWPFLVALEEAYDQSLFDLEKDWHADLNLRYTWIPVITSTATLWFLATLIFILAFLKKRRAKIQAIEEMEDDD
jgi:hypothetical protein